MAELETKNAPGRRSARLTPAELAEAADLLQEVSAEQAFADALGRHAVGRGTGRHAAAGDVPGVPDRVGAAEAVRFGATTVYHRCCLGAV